MTAIVAIKDAKGKPRIAGDSLTTKANAVAWYNDKLIRFKHCIIGFSGSRRFANFVKAFYKDEADTIKITNDKDCFEFRHKMHKKFSNFGLHKEKNNTSDGHFSVWGIIITKDKIREIDPYGYCQEEKEFATIGSWQDFVSGARSVLKEQKLPAKNKCEKLIQAAIDNDTHCGGPVQIMTL